MTDLIPVPVLFGNPERTSPRLSPDGRRLAWLAPSAGILNIWTAPVSAEAGVSWEHARVVTDDTDSGIAMFAWTQDSDRLLYVRDAEGDENWRLYDIDLATAGCRDLTPYPGTQARIIAMSPERPSDVLIGLNQDNPELHDVYRLDLVTGDLDQVAVNPGVIGWFADSALRVRGAFEPRADGSLAMLVRDDEGEWRPLKIIPAEDAMTTSLVTVSADGDSVLLITPAGSESARLVRVSLATGDEEVLASAADQRADISTVRCHPVTREPQIATERADRSQYQVLDQARAGDLAAIRALHPGDPVFEGGDNADATWLVSYTSDSGPIPYFIYDRTTRTGRLLFEHRPELTRYTLAPMLPFSYQARDGLTISGYATFPPDGPRAGLPTVLNVHGGPWARDSWGFDPEAQWLANRGYLCLQVNFRGSTGYGKSFVNAGDRQWGRAMQDDLTDAVAFAGAKGWADTDRVAIYGWSYGGYAALAGAAFTPGVYRCAVDIVGPSNLKTLIETIPPYWAPMIAQFHRRLGDPTVDADFLASISPLTQADKITIPVLIAQGANDPRVRQDEAEQVVGALRDAGIEHEYLLFPDEGHGFSRPANRMRFYEAAERFLARHLTPAGSGTPCPAAGERRT